MYQTYTTPLHGAVINNDIDAIKIILFIGFNINQQNEDGDTALSYAARSNLVKIEIAHLLIKEGADVNIGDNKGVSPLHHAVITGYTFMVTLLLKAGAEIDTIAVNKTTPIESSFTYNFADIAEILTATKIVRIFAKINQFIAIC